MKRTMIYAHLAMTMREADFLFKCFIDEWKDSIVKTKKTSVFNVKLLGGDEHCFMSCDIYKNWNKGRTYTFDGRLYHSGIPYVERRET